ncbi:MAG: alpha/beta fold hydrolase [Actinomycetota bacterium]|nr:alpha/beta fold hydrolase [Actinomycetota bacterium]
MRRRPSSPNAGLNFERQGKGEPLLLLHGIGGELCVWEPLLGVLSERAEVIAVDLPGFGRSPALPAAVAPTPGAIAATVARLLDELEIESAHIAGNSLGAWIGLELGKTPRARSVTALCPAGLWGAPLLREGASDRGRLQRIARRLRPLLPLLMLSRRARRLALAHVVADPDRVPRAAARRMVSSYARAPAYEATNTAMLASHFTGADQISVPLTVAFGERDGMVRPVRLPVPGARTLVLPSCGHIPMWDDPERVAQVVLETSGLGTERRRPATTARAHRENG